MSIISLACAHPAKFPEIISKSISIFPKNPSNLKTIMNSKEYFEIIEPNKRKITLKSYADNFTK